MTDKEKEIEEMKQILVDYAMAKSLCFSFEAYRLHAQTLYNAGYRLCGGDNCKNYKHYKEECERCTEKMGVKKFLEIESAEEHAVEEFAEKLLSELEEQKQFYDKGVKYHKEESMAAIDYCIKAVKKLVKHYGDEKQEEKQDKEQHPYEDIAEW